MRARCPHRPSYVVLVITPYEELDAVLLDLVGAVRAILGDTFVGAYLQGSFALGAGDLDSDCDFIVAVTAQPSGAAAAALRALHDDIPTRAGFWNAHLEGSYADTATLRGIDGLGAEWLYNDHGHRTLVPSAHCNSTHTRWILRRHGITMAGPPIASLVDEVPAEAMRAAARAALPGTLGEILTWAPPIAWTQRYIVTTYCRIYYTQVTAKVASKRGALEWALDTLDARWHPLLRQVIADRALGWRPDRPPRPGALDETHAFAAYVEDLSRLEGSAA